MATLDLDDCFAAAVVEFSAGKMTVLGKENFDDICIEGSVLIATLSHTEHSSTEDNYPRIDAFAIPTYPAQQFVDRCGFTGKNGPREFHYLGYRRDRARSIDYTKDDLKVCFLAAPKIAVSSD